MSPQDSLLIIDLYKAGVKAGRLGDFDEAQSNFDKILTLRSQVFGLNSYRLAPIYVNKGIQYKNSGDLNRALDSYQKAEALYLNSFGNDYPELATVYINLGNICSSNGDYVRALEYHRNAYRILKNDSIRYSQNFQVSKYNIVDVQLKLGNNREAIRFAQANLLTINSQLQPLLFDLIAQAYRNEGNYELSEKNYLNSIASWSKLLGKDNVELIPEYLAYSSLLMSIKSYDKAFSYSKMAKDLVLKFYDEKSTNYAEVLSNFGDYYYLKNTEAQQIDEFRSQRKKYLSEAIQYYQDAIVALVDSFHSKDPFTNPQTKGVISEIQLVEILKKKAIAQEKIADIYLSEFNYNESFKYSNASLNALLKSVELIHSLQIGFESEDSRLFLSQNQESTFYEAIKISYKLYSQTHKSEFLKQAFELSERSKSSNLLASVKDNKAKEFGGIPDSLLERENFLKTNIANYNSLLFEENHSDNSDTQKINLISSKIFKYNEEYSKLVKSFEKSYPQYYSLKYENRVAKVEEVQSNLSSRDALIEFYLKEPASANEKGELYRFVITKDSVSFTKDDIDQLFVDNIQSVHDFLINPNYLNTKKKDYVDYAISAFDLYQKLLKPVARTINGKSLTIIPHDKLAYIPFDALISSAPDTTAMNFRTLQYVVRDYVINYSYSATLLFDYLKNKKAVDNNLLIFAPLYVADETRIDPQSSVNYKFSPLRGATDEVAGISKYVTSDSFIDQAAQEGVFKSKARDFDILHLAMHTVINDTLPLYSKLVFSKPNENSADDGYLNTYEIYNMKLNARLAVLSACETGTGKLQKGEGVMSMARGFIYAGCPSIVMTLWQVEDKSGVRIMEDFYSFLSKGKRKDVALRMAKLNHLNNSDPLTAHPHFWLGYVNIGNPEPLYSGKEVYFVAILFGVILLVFIDWYFRKKPRKKEPGKKI